MNAIGRLTMIAFSVTAGLVPCILQACETSGHNFTQIYDKECYLNEESHYSTVVMAAGVFFILGKKIISDDKQNLNAIKVSYNHNMETSLENLKYDVNNSDVVYGVNYITENSAVIWKIVSYNDDGKMATLKNNNTIQTGSTESNTDKPTISAERWAQLLLGSTTIVPLPPVPQTATTKRDGSQNKYTPN